MPVEPPPTAWAFPGLEELARADGDVVGLGADLEPGTLLAAYRGGVFPMPLPQRRRRGPAAGRGVAGGGGREAMAWWSPDPRGVLPLDALVVSRSLARATRRFDVRVDTAFAEVVDACADPSRPSGWITPAVKEAYVRLHRLGWAHSVEAWADGEELAGGLYGVAIGGLFAGESMFHRRTDASKVALVGLVERLLAGGATLLDVQWVTPHLASLGAKEVPRRRYLELLGEAVRRPPTLLAG